MRKRRHALTIAGFALALAGCSAVGLGGGGDEPEPERTAEQRRAVCDQLALAAADAEALTEARSLATRAASCYSAEIERGDGGAPPETR